jgi:hypothetical protein
MNNNNVEIISVEISLDETRLNNAIKKLKQFDKDIVLHLEQLANLAEKNKAMFNLGLNFLKRM